jgi:hypothetical protein
VTSISDWLIDSGYSAHTTNCIDNFTGPLEQYETLVEVANGGTILVSHRVTVDVMIRNEYRSEEIQRLAHQSMIGVSFAASRHQEQNGMSEANWKHVRDLAYMCLNEPKMDESFFPLSLEHAWKLHAALPHKTLTKTNGKVQCPLGVFTGRSVNVSNFRVLFCPVVMTYDKIIVSRAHPRKERIRVNKNVRQAWLEVFNRKNSSQRGLRGIHVGFPRHSPGYLV